jgi:hypothetical protein
MSGLRVLSGLRASVESFPMSWAFPTAEYSARYDSPIASGGRSRCQYFSACLQPWSPATCRFQHCSVSGFPLPCLRSCIPYAVASHGEERLGPPKFFDVSLPACHGLRTPADLPRLAIPVGRVLPSGACKPSASAKPFRSGTSTSGCAVTPAASRIRCRRFAHRVRRMYNHDSAMDARLATGGWLALTRQGLSPCKRRQAFLGARTLGIRRGGGA